MTTNLSPMGEHDLAEIEARCEAARPSPWKSYVEGRDHTSGSNIMVGSGDTRGEDIELLGATVPDQDFIAHARQDIPRLLAEIERLKQIPNRFPPTSFPKSSVSVSFSPSAPRGSAPRDFMIRPDAAAWVKR